MFFIAGGPLDPVCIIHKNNMRLVVFCLLRAHGCIRHDDDMIADHDLSGCCTIETDHATARLSCNRVGFKTVSVLHIDDLHILVFHNACRFQKFGIDRNAPHIIQFCLGHGSTMDLSF